MKYFLLLIYTLLTSHICYGDDVLSKETKDNKNVGYLFSVPSHGLLADSMDKKAIKLGSSGHVKQAIEIIRMASSAKSILYISCKESLTQLALDKAINSLSSSELSDLKIRLDNKNKCDTDLIKTLNLKNVPFE